MEAVKHLKENNPLDERTDLEELEDLVIQMRTYRRKLTQKAGESMDKGVTGKEVVIAETVELSDLWKMYSYLEKSYNSLYKLIYPKGTSKGGGGDTGSFNLQSVREKPNLMKDIVQKTN